MRGFVTMVLGFSLCGCTTHIPVRTSLEINAPVEAVYSSLIDFEQYPEWNPYHIRIVGEPAVGAPLDVTVKRPDGKIIDVPGVHVLRLQENAEVTWGGGIKGIFYGEHVFKLVKLEGGRTEVIHNEDFSGVFIGFADLPQDVLTEGYKRTNEALKAYVEGLKEE